MSPAKRALFEKLLSGRRPGPGDTIVPAARTEEIPLSSAQRRLWFMDQLSPGSSAFNLSVALRFAGPLRIEVLARSVRELFLRHESLRTVFASPEGIPVQRILPDIEVDLAPVSLSDEEGSGTTLRDALEAEASRPFSLEHGPLARGKLLQCGQADHVLVLTIHHSVCDGWSMGMLIDELLELYAAGAEGREASLKPLPLQYADFAAWEAQAGTSDLAEGLAYWRRTLHGAPPVIELPLDRPRPATQSFRGALHRFALPSGVWSAVKEIAREERATPYMVLLAGFAALLSRYSAQGEVSVATPVANRPRVELESIVGFFANSVALRVDTSGAPTFRELVRRARDVAQEGIARSDVPFDRVVEVVDPSRSLSHAPIAQVSFALVDDPALEARLGELQVTSVDLHTGMSKYDLTLELWPGTDDELHGTFEYAADLFDEATVTRMASHLGVMLESLALTPETGIGNARLLSDEEMRETVVEWNRTDAPLVGDVSAHELFELQVRRTPDAVALVSGGRTLTFAELDRRANRLATRLRLDGVGPETRVGLFLERDIEMVVAVLASLKAGGTYVPLDVSDPTERIAFMLADADVRVVVTSRHHAKSLHASDAHVVVADDESEDVLPEVSFGPSPHPESACYIIYTSGSTGRPKGVVVSHRGLANYLAWSVDAYGVAAGGGAPLVSPLRFDMSVTTLFCPLLAGRPVVLIPEGDELDELAKSLGKKLEFGLVKVTPSHLEALERAIPYAEIEADGYLVLGGESLHGSTVAAWRKRAPGLRVVNEYGPTETVVGCSAYEVNAGTDLSGPVPIGRPIANTRMYVLDANMMPVARGTVGELYVGGACVARGYVNRPDLTAERFVPDPFATTPGERLYRTGDLARWRADGDLECLGRVDTQVKVRGYRVELEEIEAVLTRLPAVREAVVLLREDLPGEHKLVAYITAADAESPCSDETLHAELRRELPEYMVPHSFVMMDALPLTSNSKVDRVALPSPSAGSFNASYTAPATEVEQVIANVWAEVLGVSSVGRDANFLRIGGHSLLATQAVARLRDALSVDLPLRVFFEATSLADLAMRIESLRGKASRSGISPAPRTSPTPLSYAQGRLYFLSRLAEDSAFYNVPVALRLDGDFRPDAFRDAFAALWARHEGLRTYFPSVDGDPVQEMIPADKVPLEEVVLEGEANAADHLDALVDEEARKPFDLANGPLLRGKLVRLGADEHAFLMTLHHAVSDGWSLSIVMDELVALYRAFARNEPSPLAPLPITYVDYTLWQRSWLEGEELEAQLGYWQQKLADVPTLELPTDRPRPPVQSFRGARHEMAWSPELSRSISELAHREGVSLFMALLAGFDVLMARSSGQRDVTVGTPIANRTMTELERLVGFFANTLALRVDLSGDPTFSDVLQRVREAAHGAYANQDVPFEMVVDAVAPARSLSHSPLFQVRFALQDPSGGLPDPGEGLTLTVLENEQSTARFDLVVDMWETDAGLEGYVEYSTDLFDADTIAQMMARFEVLFERLVNDPGQRVFGLDILSPGERESLRALSSGTELVTGVDDLTFMRRFEEQAARYPEDPAVTCKEVTLSYGELHQRVSDLARVLSARGVGPEVMAAIYLERSVELVVAALAILKAGGAYVPLDPAYPSDRVSAIVADARPAVLLTSRGLVASAPPVLGGLLVLEDAESGALASPELQPATDLSPDRPAYVVYTSGTKGLPKGVVLTHRGLDAYVRSLPQALALQERPVFLHTASFAFSSSVRQLAVPLAHGGRVVIATRDQLASPDALLTYAAANGVDVLDLVPSYLRVVESALARHDGWQPSVILTASEPLLYDLPETIRSTPGDTPQLVNMYGQTETTGIVTVAPIAAEREGRSAVVPLGYPIGGAQVYILDEDLNQVPPGHPGEIVVGGPGLARGYLGDPTLTAERFIPSPFGPAGSRLYRTGDRGRFLPSSKLEFLGRIGDQAKIRGHRVEPDEVASALSALDGVRECVVLCLEDGADERRLVGYVALHADTAASTASLRTALKEKLPDYMIPMLVIVGAVPRLPNGKVDRAALLTPEVPVSRAEVKAEVPRSESGDTRYLDRVVDLVSIWQEVLRLPKVGTREDFFALGGDSLHVIRVVDRARKAGITITPAQFIANPTIAELAAVATETTAPSSGAEDALVSIWQEVLRLPKVGTREDFFALGGDSLHVIRVVDRARKAGITITPAQFIANPTIAELAAVATDANTRENHQVATGAIPLVPSHHAFLERNFADKHLYTHVFVFETTEPLEPKFMEGAVECVVVHHDSLRISFPCHEGVYRLQVQERFERVPFTSVDLSALEPTDQDVALGRLENSLHRQLDYSSGPLLHVALVRLGHGRPDRLIAIVHHQLMDNSSWGVLLEDLQMSYAALAAGLEPQLPPPTGSFASWARNMDRLAHSSSLDEDIAYWTALAQRPIPRLPLDHKDGDNCLSSEEAVVVKLDAAGTAALRRTLPRAHGLTMNDALLAAMLQGFADWSGQTSILVDLAARGRELGGDDLDLSRAIGRFPVTSPRLLALPEIAGPHTLLASVAEQVRAVPRGGLGFGLLRYIGSDPSVAKALAPLATSDILLSNWGEYEQRSDESPLLGSPLEEAGPVPKLARMHRLIVNARISGGELNVAFRFSRNLHDRESIEHLARLVEQTLKSFVRTDGA
ncbi:amino acid adenylation domain-containing protein [Streptomyces virginiae]